MSEKLTITIPAGLMDSMFERFWDSEQDDVNTDALNKFCVDTLALKHYSDTELRPNREDDIRQQLITMAHNDQDVRELTQIARAQSTRVAELETQIRLFERAVSRLEARLALRETVQYEVVE